MAQKKLTPAEMKQMINDLAREPRPSTSEKIADKQPFFNEEPDQPLSRQEFKNAPKQILAQSSIGRRSVRSRVSGQYIKISLVIALILTIPVIWLSPIVGSLIPQITISVPYQSWVILGISTLLLLIGGMPFFSGAVRQLAAKKPAMMTLTSLAMLAAYAYSVYATVMNYLQPNRNMTVFFWELAILIDVMLLGYWLEIRALKTADATVNGIEAILPEKAHLLADNDTITEIAIGALQVGDRISVRSGEVIPADSRILLGTSRVDEALLTGETNRITKTVDDTVLGGSINGNGDLELLVTQVGVDSFIARVQALVLQTHHQKSSSTTRADKLANRIFYTTLIFSLLALALWTYLKGVGFALPIMVTMLVIACPQAFALTFPLVSARLTTLAAQRGLLIQQREPLEHVKALKYALMDKTGTLTAGKFKIRSLKSISDEYSDSDILAIMATLEADSTHPLAQGIIKLAQERQVSLMQISEVEAIPGVGVKGGLNNQRFALVALDYLIEHDIPFDQEYFDKLADAGNTVSFLVTTGKVVGIVAQGDEIKAEAIKFIRALKKLGIMPVMLTGDNQVTAQQVAQTLAITDVHASLKPADKAHLVKEYQAKGLVMMIGDGLNDSPALAQSDLGIALGSGTDVAIETADIVLVHDNPLDILKLLQLAEIANKKAKQNLWWGAIYNILALLLSAGVLIPFGIHLNPLIGAILMMLATIVIVFNARRLRIK